MTAKRALITGITGQDGAYLSRFLIGKGYEVHGTTRSLREMNPWRLHELTVEKYVQIHEMDLCEKERIEAVLRDVQPSEIYNLAAWSFVASSWEKPVLTADINALGTLRLLEAVRQSCPHARFYQASTSEMYGNSHHAGVQNENTPLHPRSPYAISKLFAHWTTVNERESFGLFACCGILFNHESPLRGLEFVTRKISDSVARIKLGMADSLALGNLDAKRDWGFAGDYVEVMWRMLQQQTPEEFVISTGVTHSVRDFLTLAFQEIGINDWHPYVRTDPRYLRPVEVEELSGSNDKAKTMLGWEPKVNFAELVSMMVRRDLERLSQAPA